MLRYTKSGNVQSNKPVLFILRKKKTVYKALKPFLGMELIVGHRESLDFEHCLTQNPNPKTLP